MVFASRRKTAIKSILNGAKAPAVVTNLLSLWGKQCSPRYSPTPSIPAWSGLRGRIGEEKLAGRRSGWGGAANVSNGSPYSWCRFPGLSTLSGFGRPAPICGPRTPRGPISPPSPRTKDNRKNVDRLSSDSWLEPTRVRVSKYVRTVDPGVSRRRPEEPPIESTRVRWPPLPVKSRPFPMPRALVTLNVAQNRTWGSFTFHRVVDSPISRRNRRIKIERSLSRETLPSVIEMHVLRVDRCVYNIVAPRHGSSLSAKKKHCEGDFMGVRQSVTLPFFWLDDGRSQRATHTKPRLWKRLALKYQRRSCTRQAANNRYG